VYYTERKPKNKKRGRPGNEASAVPLAAQPAQVHTIKSLEYSNSVHAIQEVKTLRQMSAIYTHSPTSAHICPKGRHEPAQVLTIKSLECSTPTVQDFEETVPRCSSQEIYNFCFY